MARHLPQNWTLPALEPRNRAFFTEGRLVLQQCAGCGAVQHPPEDLCRQCQSVQLGSVEASGRGTIHSYTVVHHPLHPELRASLPYNVILVQLEDHPHVRITGNLVGASAERLEIGRGVRVVFEEVFDEASGERYRLPQWELE